MPSSSTPALVAYDEAWPDLYQRAADELSALLGDDWLLEHIGSTSVPGLVARPIIDIAVRIPRGGSLRRHSRGLMQLGWQSVVGGPRNHAVRVKLAGERRSHIAHFFPTQMWHLAQQRLFADWLRRHPEDLAEYASLKQRLVEEGLVGLEYTAAKTAFVQGVLDRARIRRGVAPTNAWEK